MHAFHLIFLFISWSGWIINMGALTIITASSCCNYAHIHPPTRHVQYVYISKRLEPTCSYRVHYQSFIHWTKESKSDQLLLWDSLNTMFVQHAQVCRLGIVVTYCQQKHPNGKIFWTDDMFCHREDSRWSHSGRAAWTERAVSCISSGFKARLRVSFPALLSV